MKKVLFVDGCLRGNVSRTRRIAGAFLEELAQSASFSSERVEVDKEELFPVGEKELEERGRLLQVGELSHPSFRFARQFAAADHIVVAAPFWDMGIPAKLRTYFENVSIDGFTFKGQPDGDCVGVCRAERMTYITTRGMDIPDGSVLEQASPYLRALCLFFGIKKFGMISAYRLDMAGEDVSGRVDAACKEARAFARSVAAELRE